MGQALTRAIVLTFCGVMVAVFGALLALAWAQPSLAGSGDGMSLMGVSQSGGASAYVGPGDIVSGATGWYSCTRSYNAAYNTGSNKACNLRRASDSTTQDFNILSNGKFDSASANTFAGNEGTCTGAATSSTTLSCTGWTKGSTAPTVGDTLTGTGLVQPAYITACGTFTSGTGTCTMNAAQTVAATVTFQYGLFVTEAYDQSGNTNHVVQATAANQPQWLPNCGTNSLPCMFFVKASSQILRDTTVGATLANASVEAVSQRTSVSGSADVVLDWGAASSGGYKFQWGTSSGQLELEAAVILTGVTENVLHQVAGVQTNTTGSLVYSDNTGTSGTTTAQSSGTTIALGGRTDNATTFSNQYLAEAGIWNNVAFTTTQIGNLCHNGWLFYQTATSC